MEPNDLSKFNNLSKFPDGLRFFPRRDTAPEWIQGSISVDPAKFVAWMKENKEKMSESLNGGKYFRFDVKLSKEGKLYVAVNDYKPAVRETFHEDVPFP